MKKLLIILFSIGLAVGASAQHRVVGGHFVRPRVTIIGGYAPVYPYYSMGYGFGYPFYNYPPYYTPQPSKLDLEIEDIKNDYNDRIWSVKHDDALAKADKKAKVRELKHERDMAVEDAKRNYYKKAEQEDRNS
jgi:hypothetical protein